MKNKIFIYFLFFANTFYSQQSKGELKQISKNEINKIFSKEQLIDFGVNFPIQSAYTYTDNLQEKIILLTESNDSIGAKKDTCNFKIKAVGFTKIAQSYQKNWEINDFIIRGLFESSIWFWTKYTEANDYNKDGKQELYLVYGSNGANDLDDGRLKFVVVIDNKKYVVRHQSGVTDYMRNMQVDKSFYDLPLKIQEKVMSIMGLIQVNQKIIFPYGWEKAMKMKKIKISE